jgi:hypothetical protein
MERILAGCVAENTPLFFRRALNLVRSIRWFGGKLAEADVAVCLIDDARPEYRERLEAAGARVHVVARWPENPMFNKVSILTVPGVEEYDCVCVLDCDLVVAQDPTPFLRPGVVQCKIADVDTVPYATFVRVCERFSLPLPPPTYLTTVDRMPILRYCNTGVLFAPPKVLLALLVPWKRYELLLAADPSLLGPHHHHRQQAAFALAMIEQPVEFEELSVALNFPLNQTNRPPTSEMAACDPVILHYHHAMDELGYLLPAPYPRVQHRIRLFNARVSEEGRRRAGPILFGIGSQDSGTTNLLSLLGRHPQLAALPETGFIPDVARACRLTDDAAGCFVDAILGHPTWPECGLDAERLRERVADIEPFDLAEALRAFYQLYAERFGKERWADASAIYALHVEQIQELLPEARFVQVVREVGDVALSPVSRVDAVRRRAHRLRHYLEIRHEDLVDDPEGVLRQVCDFVELPWDPALLSGRPEDAVTPSLPARDDPAPAPGRARPVTEVAVCVAGMHRSGTSVTAGLLHACGVLMGERGSFLDPARDNPLGYWEDQRFTALNEAVLGARGGGWDTPPDLTPGWERSPELLELREAASTLLESRGADRDAWWGFKDPRATLTFPFWKLLVPHLRLVVCLRNPLEVAHSLGRRHRTSIAFGLRLWESYHRALRAATTPDERLLTRYDTLQRAPRDELRRVLDRLGLRVSEEVVNVACAQVVDRLRHHEVTAEDLVESEASDAVLSLYLDLCAEAEGQDLVAGRAEREIARALEATTREQYRAARRQERMDLQLREEAREIAALKADNAALEADNTALEADKAALQAESAEIHAQLAEEQRQSQQWATAREEREREVAGHYASLAQHAETLSRIAEDRRQQVADLERLVRVREAEIAGRTVRGLLSRIFRYGRKVLHGVAGKSA